MPDYSDSDIEQLQETLKEARAFEADAKVAAAADIKQRENNIKGAALQAELEAISNRTAFLVGAAQQQKPPPVDADAVNTADDDNTGDDNQDDSDQNTGDDNQSTGFTNPMVNVPGFSESNTDSNDEQDN